MSRVTRWVVGLALVALVVGGLGWLTRFGYAAHPDDEAALRLSWRARVPRVEECRRLTAEEQAQLPVHMRREEICEGRYASYRLAVLLDGDTVRSAVVAGAGARGDRPLFVFEELRVPAEEHRLEISFVRVGAGSHERSNRAGDSVVPDTLRLETSIALRPREVALVVYDAERRRLELLRSREE